MFDRPAPPHPSGVVRAPLDRPDRVALGIDPGLSRCGYGVVRRAGPDLEVIDAGLLRTPPTDPLAGRLAQLAGEVEALVAAHAPDAVVVERVLFQHNARTAMSVGQASGVALVAAARAGVPVAQVSPNEVKLAVTGDGAAAKAQVQAMVSRLLHLAVPPPPDVADALALACCHLWSSGLRALRPASSGALERAIAAAVAREGP